MIYDSPVQLGEDELHVNEAAMHEGEGEGTRARAHYTALCLTSVVVMKRKLRPRAAAAEE